MTFEEWWSEHTELHNLPAIEVANLTWHSVRATAIDACKEVAVKCKLGDEQGLDKALSCIALISNNLYMYPNS